MSLRNLAIVTSFIALYIDEATSLSPQDSLNPFLAKSNELFNRSV